MGTYANTRGGRLPRKPRIEYPGAFHHVMYRGNNGEFILTEKEKERNEAWLNLYLYDAK